MKKLFWLIFFTALCGGSVVVFGKIALIKFEPFTLTFIRFFLASLSLLPFVHKKSELSFGHFKKLYQVAVLGALNPILLFIALKTTQASVAPLIYASVPLMTAIYLNTVKKQKLTDNQTKGIIVGFLGVTLIILMPLVSKGAYLPADMLFGNVLILGAAFAFMLYGLASKRKQVTHEVSPIALTFYFSLVTMVLSIPFAVFELINQPITLSSLHWTYVLSAVEIGIVGTSLFYVLYQYALKVSSEVTASLFTYLQPVITIVMAVLLLGEKVTIPLAIGGVLAIYGARLATRK